MVKQKGLIVIMLLVLVSISSTFSYATIHDLENSTIDKNIKDINDVIPYGSINMYYDIEPNNTIEDAQSVERNNDSHKATVAGDSSELHRVHGELSTEDDIDFYHVYLYKNGSK